MKRLFSSTALSLSLALAVLIAGCGTPGGSSTGSSTVPSSGGRHVLETAGGGPMMNASLYDAPLPSSGDVHVYLAIAGLDVVADGIAAIVVSYAAPPTVDLLTLKHTPYPLQGALPRGTYDTLRLVVDAPHSYVTVDGKVYPMIFTRHGQKLQSRPSAVGLDAKVPIDGTSGQSVNISVDFNVLESISLHGGYAYATPKLIVAKGAAQVKGSVLNASGGAVRDATVIAYDATGHVANTTITDEDGSFALHALEAGSYTVTVRNEYVAATGEAVVAKGATSVIGPSVHLSVAPGDGLILPPLND